MRVFVGPRLQPRRVAAESLFKTQRRRSPGAIGRLSGLAAATVLAIGLTVIPAGSLVSPAAADSTNSATHGLGLLTTPGLTRGISAAAAALAQATTIPGSADLSQWDPPVGNQGPVGSCGSWATGYYYRYWLRNHATGETSTFAPMYLYSQISKGVDSGSSFPANFAIMESQGIDHEVDYSQGDYDYTDQPTSAEVTAAAPYKITSYSNLFFEANSGNQAAVEASIAAGIPVLLGIPVYDNFYFDSGQSFIDVPSAGMKYYGNHAVFAPKYDAAGVWIENSWGTSWGQAGWAELSWAFVDEYANEAWNMTGDPATMVVSAIPSPYVAGATHSATVTAKDAAGNPAAGYRGTVRFTSTDPAAVLPAAYTFTGADGGTHTFSVTLRTAGTRSVTATDTVTPSITGSQNAIVVNPGSATQLTVSGLPSPYRAGSAQSLTVTAKDAYGNTATGYTGTVQFGSSDQAAVLPANASLTAGVGTFSVTLRTAGTRSVTATDTVTPSITGSQNAIVVNPGSATQLTVSGLPSPYRAGSAQSLTVTAKDAYGNTATGYTGTVHLTSSDSAAVLPADYIFTSGDAGTHTFSVTLKTCDTQSVTATDTATASITGSQHNITVVNYPAATYVPTSPRRVLDSRPTGSGHTNIGLAGKFTAGVVRKFSVAGAKYVGGGSALAVPANAVAVTGNLTIVGETAAGVVDLGPTVSATGSTTTINFVVGDTRANDVTLGLAGDGSLEAVYRISSVGATTDLIFDVTGYFLAGTTGATYHSLVPGRVLDTRPAGSGVTHIGPLTKLPNKAVKTFPVAGVKGLGWSSALVPSNATAVTGNLTVTGATSAGFVSVGPTMTSSPSTSSVNVAAGTTVANGVTVALSGGKLQVVWCGTSGSSANVIFDVTGYFSAGSGGLSFYALTPVRVLDSSTSLGLSGTFASGTAQLFIIGGTAGVPTGVAGISGNLTVLTPTSAGWALVSPEIVPTPTTSTLNVASGHSEANGFDVSLGSGGHVALEWAGTTGSTADIALDITGYWG